MLSVPQIARIQDKNLADAMQRIVDHINRGSKAIRVDPSGLFPAPKQVAGISVAGGAGILDVQLTDNSVINSGDIEPITYWVEYSTDPNFINPPPYQVPLPGARNVRIPVPSGKFYVRGYSQYFGSHPSPPIVFGGATPAQVDCTTPTTPPAQGSQGSGSNPPGLPGQGYGVLPRFVPPNSQ